MTLMMKTDEYINFRHKHTLMSVCVFPQKLTNFSGTDIIQFVCAGEVIPAP